MTTPQKTLGVLQCGRAPEVVARDHGEYLGWFEALLGPHGFQLRNWDVENLDMPAGPEAADAWLIGGSRHGAYEDHAFIPPLEAFIRAVVSAQKPLVGICFGHQIIAQALGGRVEKFAGGWQFGRKDYDVAGLGQMHLNAIHQDQVLRAPEGAEVIASTPGCQIAGLKIGAHCVTLQPHPEIPPKIMVNYVENFRLNGRIGASMIDAAEAALTASTNERQIGGWLAQVLGGETR